MRVMPGEIERQDDAAPVEMLAALFEARGWTYEFVSDDEITCEVQASWATYQLRGIWRSEDNVLQLLCMPDIYVLSLSPTKRKRAPDRPSVQAWEGTRCSIKECGNLKPHLLSPASDGCKLYLRTKVLQALLTPT